MNLEGVYQCREDDDVSESDPLRHQERAGEQVLVQHLEGGQQVGLCTLHILQTYIYIS